MNNRALTPTLIVVVLLAAAAFAPFPPWAQAQSVCDIFPPTTGGIPEADFNGDGLTCEFNTIDPVTGVWMTIAVDNEVVEKEKGCPDHFTPPSEGSNLCCKLVGPEDSKNAHLNCIGPEKKKAKKK
jgi:hypothetical protein